jgi:hypothetical protein
LVLSWNEMLFTKINLVSLFIHKARVHWNWVCKRVNMNKVLNDL